LRQQLGYVRRNLAHIDTLIAAGAMLSELKKNLYRNLLVERQPSFNTKSLR
jgi:hypothetical protein